MRSDFSSNSRSIEGEKKYSVVLTSGTYIVENIGVFKGGMVLPFPEKLSG